MTQNEDNRRYRQISDEQVVAQIVRSNLHLLIHDYFSRRSFLLVDPPVLHEQIKDKKHEIYLPLYSESYSLNSSNALYMAAYASFFKRVYSVSSAFRDEQNSVNHLVEFKMLEVEMLDMTYEQLPDFIEAFILFILENLSKVEKIKCYPSLCRRIKNLQDEFRPSRISYANFVCEVERTCGYSIAIDTDLSDIDYIVSEYINTPIFILEYPKSLATWTSKPLEDHTACALNLLLPGTYGELCEGCERNNHVPTLKKKMEQARIDNLQWYIDAVETMHNTTRCGFGIGIDRLVRWIIGAAHIKDTVLFPRMRAEQRGE